MMDKGSIVSATQQYFEQESDVCAVYLFGSVAKNKSRSSSDVDLAVLFMPETDDFARFDRKLRFAADLEELLLRKVDVVDLNSADDFFVHQVMLNKQLIVERDRRQRVAFEVNRRKCFFDRQPFYDLYHAQAMRRLKELK